MDEFMEDGVSKLGKLRRKGNEKNLKSSEAESPRWQSKRIWAHLLLWELQNNNSLLNMHWQDNVGCHQKKILHIQGQMKTHSKMIIGAKSFLESNPIPTRDTQRAQTNPVHTRTPRPCRGWARTVYECLLWKYESAEACQRAGALGAADLVMA